jgi:formiminotetrahydrofolate cyclodeaminase
MVSLSQLADSDSLAFQGYLEASALPQATEAEKATRKIAKEASLVRATQVPLEAAVEMGRGLESAEAATGLVDTHVRSEVSAGGMLLRASIRSVLLSVDANLPGISDASMRAALKQQRDELERALSIR